MIIQFCMQVFLHFCTDYNKLSKTLFQIHHQYWGVNWVFLTCTLSRPTKGFIK
jgi:hypothetical protein